MINKKKTGSFYTPKIISDFLVEYLNKKINGKNISILEPSAGDGSFIQSIYNHKLLSKKIKKVVAVEREKIELEKIKNITNKKSLITIHSDFLEFQNNNKQKFDLVIGNPPYIKKNLLEVEQILYCDQIHKIYPSLSENKIKNIWTAFLVRSINFVKENGILALVLPAELLQVKYAVELRNLLKEEFERVEIFTFKELLFDDCKGQDTLLLICEKYSKNKGVYFTNIDDVNNLKNLNFKLNQNIHIQDSKWNHQLSSDEYELLFKLRDKIKIVNHYCTSKAGIVTAANDYFIVNKEKVNEFLLEEYTKPIIQKGFFVNGSVELNDIDFYSLVKESKPTYLIDLNIQNKVKSVKLKEYIKIGEKDKLNERYKMRIREDWYKVPNIGIPSEAFFFKRCNEYPKFIKNNANVLVTDSAYKISMNGNYKINNLIYSFYNSLTLSFAELNGRYYGGGVLELTPNEFKNLPVPYIDISMKEFNSFVKNFKIKSSIKEVCLRNDASILKTIDTKIDIETIEKIYNIREKLFSSRTKSY